VSRLDDGALVELARARDIDAFEELLNRHRRLICDVCVRLTFNEQDAEDAVQAVQLAVWQGIGSFEGTAKFSTWLYRVASNTTIGQVRRRVPEPTGQVPEQAATGSLVDGRVTDVHAVRWALARLPPEFRTTLVLRECLDLSLEEIADIQIISIGTVKSRLSRARQAVAALLVERAE
jgi:RNA polymerase sigma-70 factor (ECF subfamily)